ncbi:hypothetical protein Tco_0172933 [Tanacetum coccineum]
MEETQNIHRPFVFSEGSTRRPPTTDFSSCQRRDDRDGRNSPGKDFRRATKESTSSETTINTKTQRITDSVPTKSKQNNSVPNYSLDSLKKCPKEILATETQLQLPPPRPVANPLRTGDPDKYCDYHQDKGHHTNDCIQLRKQLEIALESGKLNHLMKDLRQRNEGPRTSESWMNTPPISFHCNYYGYASDEPLIIETELRNHVRRVSVEMMKGHLMEVIVQQSIVNLPETSEGPDSGNTENYLVLVLFRGGSETRGKIDLEVCFGNVGLSRRTSMKFIIHPRTIPLQNNTRGTMPEDTTAIYETNSFLINFPTPNKE